MSQWSVPLADVRIAPEDLEAILDVYRSGWLSMGPRTEQLEARLAAYVGARHAIATSSGTAALHLMCAAAGLGPGDEVIVPSMTFVATANAVAYTGARPVFAEIASLQEPWLSASAARAALTPRTRAVLAMGYGGHAGEIVELQRLCRERGLLLLEDAAHGLGSRLEGRHLGTFGAMGAYSFFSNKNLAVGEGGALVTDDEQLARRARLLRSHGMTSLTWDRHRGHASDYDVVALGYNYRIDEPRAALACSRLARLDEENARRARLDLRYRRLLEGEPLSCALAPTQGLRCAHHLFCVVLDETIDRDGVRAALAAAGVQSSVHYPPVHRFAVHRADVSLKITDAYARRALTLPMFAHMTDAQQDAVVAALRGAVRTAARTRAGAPS